MAKFFKRNPGRSVAASESLQIKFEAVEPRVLFSATAVDPVEQSPDSYHDLPQVQEEAQVVASATPVISPVEADAATPGNGEDQIIESLNHHAADLDASEAREIVFISSGLFDQDYIANQLDPTYEFYLIEPGRDAIQQIAEVLQGRSDVSAIHLIGHGEEGRLFLSGTVLDAESIEGAHREQLEVIGQSLTANADILIYGCDFASGETGVQAAALLAAITGADVAASTDQTGHVDFGGNWDLEVEIGLIEAQGLSLDGWYGALAPLVAAPPVVTAPSTEVSTLEDVPLVFSGPYLIQVGSETSPTLTVTLSVGQGALHLSGTTGITFLNGTANGNSSLEVSGTVANLNAALNGLTFTPVQDSFGSEILAITASDGVDTTGRSINLSVVSQNDAPVLVVNPVNAAGTGTPSETTPHTFTLADFRAVDPDNSDNQLTFILKALPTTGKLRLHGFPVAVGTIFSQAELASGALVYIHDGGEIHTDSFTLTVNDGAGGTDALVVIPITITKVNDPMTVVTDAIVYEGGSTNDIAPGPGKPVPVFTLGITDAEADLKTVTITSLPGGGSLYFNGTLITAANVTAGFSFSAANYSQLEYRHDGVDNLTTQPGNRSFTITVKDLGGGAGAGAIQTVNQTVNIIVVPVNDELRLVTLSTNVQTIAPAGSYVLSLADLEVSDPDGPSAQITYILQTTPLQGNFYINGQLSGAGATFTQAQLAGGMVAFYNGNGSGPESLFFKVTDSQISILTDELGMLRTGDYTTPARVLELKFNFVDGGGGGGGGNGFLKVREGFSAPLMETAPGDVIRLSSSPARGQVLVNGTPLGVGVNYTVKPGDAVTYQHNGVHVDNDVINLIVNGTPRVINVAVLLTNDAPVLTIPSSLTGVREGFSITIATAHLSATDEETTNPAQLQYTMTGSPGAGSILRDGNILPFFGTFTHQDVIDGLITYKHNGDERFLDSVKFNLSDGSSTVTGTLSIQVIPVNDQPTVTANFMELLEGASKPFTAALLGVADVDGNGDDIGLAPDAPLQIRIDSLPTRGALYYNDPINGITLVTAGFTFNHAQIGRLSYQHDSSENFADNFNFTVLDNNTYSNPGFDAPGNRAGVMNIGIIPVNDAPAVTVNAGLINDGVEDRRVYEGGTRVITMNVLSSIDPDSTNEQVQYRITSGPANGALLFNGNRIGAGSAFTQNDLLAGRISYQHNGSETSTDQFKFRIDDGSSNVAEQTFKIGIIAVNDAPTISAPGTTVVNTADFQFTGSNTVRIADSDAATGDVTVTLTASDPGGFLRVTTTTGLTSVTGNNTSNVLVLVGDVAEINAALATLRYRTTDLDSHATLTINVNDGGNTGVDPSQVSPGEISGLVNTGTNFNEQANWVIDLLVSPIDDAPVNTVPGPQTAYEDVNFVFNIAKGNAISISDVDAFYGDVQVTLSVAHGTLTLGAIDGLTFITGDGVSDATMTFQGTVAEINAALEGLKYLGNLNYEGPELLTITTNDLGNTGAGGPLSDVDTVAITVIGVNDAPIINGPSSNVLVNRETFLFNGGNTISVSDTDVRSGLVTVTLMVNDPSGILELTQLTGLTAVSGNGTSNTLTFTGTLSNVNNALASLAYQPTDLNSGSTLTVHVSDNGNTGIDPSSIGLPHTGTLTDEQATRVFQIRVSDFNNSPVNTVPEPQTFKEDTSHTFSTLNGNAISIDDVDAFIFDVTTTITVTHGTLTAGGSASDRAALLSLSGSGTNTLVLKGTLWEINAVLQGLSYQGVLNYNGSDTLTIVTDDLGNTGPGGSLTDTDTVALTITPVNDAPTQVVPAKQNVNEDSTLVFSTAKGNVISVADVDVAEGTGLLTVTLGVTKGTLSLSGTSGLSFTSGDGTTDPTMTFSGTAANINAALQGLTFNPTADYNGPAVLSITTNDNGNTGSGGPLSVSSSVNITVAPVVDITPDTVTTLEDTSISFDVIAGTNGATADNFEGTPVLSAINGTAVTSNSSVSVANGTVKIDAVTGLLTFTPTLNFNGTTTFTYTVTSPAGVTETAQVTVNVTPVNDAPVNTVPGTQTFSEDTTRIFSTGNANALSISDVDAGNADVTTTITVASGTLTAGGTAPQRAALTSLTGSGTNTLVLTGSVAEINAVLQGLAYKGVLNFNGSDTLTIVTNDLGNTGAGGPLSDTDTVALTITPVNDAPTQVVPGAQNVNEDTALVFSTAKGNVISVADVDVADGTGLLTVTLGVTNGTLSLSGTSGLTFTTGDGTTDPTMTFTGTAANINAALQGLTFNPTADYNGPAVLSITTNDNGNTGSGGPLVTKSTVNINVAPVVDITPDTVTTLEDTAISFNVITGTNGATADNFEGTPVLSAINGTAVIANSSVSVDNGSVKVDAVSGLLTFTPNADYNGTTTFTYTVTSPAGVTETAEVTVTVSPINDAPVNMVPGTQTFSEDTTRVFSTANGNALSISDVDAGNADVTTTIIVAHGTLTAGGNALQQAALTSLTGSGTNTLVLTGSITEINAVLQGLAYTGTLNFNGSDTLTIVTNDLGNTGAGGQRNDTDTVALTITPVNDAPTQVVPGAQNVNEDTALVFSTGNSNGISVADVDALEGTGLLTVTVGVTNGTLSLSGTSGLTFTTGDGTTDPTMTFTGTAANINAALQGLTYNPTADYNGPAVLSITTNDNGNTGSGGPLSVSSSVNITVAPVVDITADTVTTLEDNAISFNVITGTNGATADNFEGTPVLSAINGTAVISNSSVSVDNGTVKVDAVSGLLTFTPNANFSGTTTFTYTVTSPAGVTETALVTVNVSPVNDAPLNTVPGVQTLNEDTTQVFSTANGNAISISDPDAANADVTTTITVAHGTLTAGGNALQQAALTTLTGSGSNTLVLTGSIAEINAVLQGLAYTGNLNFNGNDTLTIVTNDLGNTGAGGPLSDTDTVALTITPVNDAPTQVVPGAQNVNEDTALVFSTANGNVISVADVDALAGTGLLTVTVGVTNGILSLSGTSGLSFTSGDGTTDPTMTFTGTAANINAALQGLTFNPTADYNGPAVLSITTNDNGNSGTGGPLSVSSSVDITVAPVVDITADTVTTLEDNAISFNVITGTNGATADNFEGTPVLSAIDGTAVSQGSSVAVANGIVKVDAVTGLLTFTPTLNYNGTTSFNYTVTSPAGITETAQVIVNVTPANDAPVNIVPAAQNVNEDTSLVFSSANGNALSITDVDATTGLMTVTLSVTNGSLTLSGTAGLTFASGDGTSDTTMTFSGTLADINLALEGLAFNPVADYNGPAALTISTSDNGNSGSGGSLSDTDIVAITVAPIADITNDSVTTHEDTAVTFNVITGSNGATADNFEGTPVLTAINGVTVTAGSVIVVNDGTVTVDATSGLLSFTPDAHFNGSTTFTYTVTSPAGVTETATVTVTVAAQNDAPVNTVPGSQNVNEDTGLTFSGPNGNAISVADVDALEGTGLLTVTLTATNGTLSLNGSVGLTFTTGDGIADPTMTFTGTVADINAALEGMTFNPTADYNGPAGITLVTSDNGNSGTGGVLIDTDTIAITVVPVVDITDDEVVTDEDTAITFNVITGSNGATADNFEGTPVLTAINGTPVSAGSSIKVTNGTVVVDATTGLLTFTPDLDFYGEVTFSYTVTSPTGVTETALVTVEVKDVNDDPVDIGVITDQENDDSDPVSLDVTDFFDDVDPTDVLTYTATELPPGLTLDLNTGLITGTIDSSASVGGPYTVVITADDGNGGTFTQTFIWTVSNPTPIAVNDQFNATQNGGAIVVGNAITNNDRDPDGDVLVAIVQNNVPGDNGGLFSIAVDGKVTFNPNGAFTDLFGGETRETSFTYTIVDADGATATATVTVTVIGVNEPPVAGSGRIKVKSGSQGTRIRLTAPVDPDGDPLTITVSQLPKKGTLRLASGQAVKIGQILTEKELEGLVFDAPAKYKGKKPVRFTYTVSDGQYVTSGQVDITILQSKSGGVCYVVNDQNGKGKNKNKS